jgi:hypothetical protein
MARLVYETFVDKIKDGTKLVYKDGDEHNYTLDNLEVANKYNKVHTKTTDDLDKSKTWKPLVGHEDLYKISDHGDIFSISTNKLLNPQVRSGYNLVVLTKDKIKKKYYVHQLVFMTHIKEIADKTKFIDHIDGNKLNNHVKNLKEISKDGAKPKTIKTITKNPEPESIIQYNDDGQKIKEWISMDEIIKQNPKYKRDTISHCCTESKKTAYGYVWRYKNYAYDQSDYCMIKTNDSRSYSNYQINKNGDVINCSNGKPISLVKNDYYSVKMTSDCGNRRTFPVHELVALTFIDNPNKYPNIKHVDGDKFNNVVENLEWTGNKISKDNIPKKKVKQIDPNTGKVIGTFNSISLAFESLNKDKGNAWGIGRACSGKQDTAHGYKWKFA